MAFKETFETPFEAEGEIQRFLTFLKEHSHESRKMVEKNKPVKAYGEELKIEEKLKFLMNFVEAEKKQMNEELQIFMKAISRETLRIKCNQVEERIQEDFGEEDDYGEE